MHTRLASRRAIDYALAVAFGRNPYVAKAESAEQKAAEAPDDASRVRAHREAAHEWGRAAAREKPGKRRDEYERNAEKNRGAADAELAAVACDAPGSPGERAPQAREAPEWRFVSQSRVDPHTLN